MRTFWHHLATLVVLCSFMLTGCAQARVPAANAATPPLVPLQTLQGARLLLEDEQGKIAYGSWVNLIFPVAVAASPFEMYIADAGSRRLYRYDAALDALTVMPDIAVNAQTRLAIGLDGSVYVASPGIAPLRRYTRNGTRLTDFDPRIGAARYDDIALDRASGMVYGLDRTFGRIEEIHPLGRSAMPLFDDLQPESPLAIATDGQRLYFANQRCGCIIATDLLHRTRSIIARDFRQPAALAAENGWLVVLDSFERKLNVYHNDQLRGAVRLETLQLADPRGITLNNGLLYVADAGGNRISIFRLNK